MAAVFHGHAVEPAREGPDESAEQARRHVLAVAAQSKVVLNVQIGIRTRLGSCGPSVSQEWEEDKAWLV